jgi:hypothetical protein
MKDIYDLTLEVPFDKFPWEEINLGIKKSNKSPTRFYGHPADAIGLGSDIFLTSAVDRKNAWYKLAEKENWKNNINMNNFPLLQTWITNLTFFKNTGRILFFLQEAGKFTPAHIDEDINRAPIEYQIPSEFIWLTNSVNGKKLIVNGNQAPYACWFNSYLTHNTIPSDTETWSLRIDGKFTDEFKQKIMEA